MVEECRFDPGRVASGIARLKKATEQKGEQKRMDSFFQRMASSSSSTSHSPVSSKKRSVCCFSIVFCFSFFYRKFTRDLLCFFFDFILPPARSKFFCNFPPCSLRPPEERRSERQDLHPSEDESSVNFQFSWISTCELVFPGAIFGRLFRLALSSGFFCILLDDLILSAFSGGRGNEMDGVKTFSAIFVCHRMIH